MNFSKRIALFVISALFVLTTPSFGHVILDAPNGGETLEVGSVFTITWYIEIVHDLLNWDLWYSTTGAGGPWIPIEMNLPPGSPAVGSVHTYDWTVPEEAVSDQVRVRVHMDNYFDIDYEDVSDGDVTVTTASGGFIRGDADGDNAFNGLNDALFILTFQFAAGAPPVCMEAADADDDGVLNGLADSLYLLTHQFVGGPPPPPPYPDCDTDQNPTDLGCEAFSC